MSIPPILNQEAQFSGWMACFHALMMKPLPLVSRGRAACRASEWRLLVLWHRRMAMSHAGGHWQLRLVLVQHPAPISERIDCLLTVVPASRGGGPAHACWVLVRVAGCL